MQTKGYQDGGSYCFVGHLVGGDGGQLYIERIVYVTLHNRKWKLIPYSNDIIGKEESSAV